jgi:hypothetical protein
MTNRVVNTIRSWLDTHYIEIQDAPILERVEKFAEDLQSEGSQTMSKQLQGLVARKASRFRSYLKCSRLTFLVAIGRIGRTQTYHLRRSPLTPRSTTAPGSKWSKHTSPRHFARRASPAIDDH